MVELAQLDPTLCNADQAFMLGDNLVESLLADAGLFFGGQASLELIPGGSGLLGNIPLPQEEDRPVEDN